jgi:hypothetical protein
MNIGGAAAHGDYVFGWKDNSLQLAMDNRCNLNAACPAAGLTTQTPAQYNACKKKQQAKEDVDGCTFYSLSLSVSKIWLLIPLFRAQGNARRQPGHQSLKRDSLAPAVRSNCPLPSPHRDGNTLTV